MWYNGKSNESPETLVQTPRLLQFDKFSTWNISIKPPFAWHWASRLCFVIPNNNNPSLIFCRKSILNKTKNATNFSFYLKQNKEAFVNDTVSREDKKQSMT